MKHLALLLALFLGYFTAYSQDNSADKFSANYKKFWSQPVDNWAEIVNEKKQDVYQIQKKDTLSELSKVFFGTMDYWPKIWSVNEYIGNPHLIYPENQLVFIAGNVSTGEAPRMILEPKDLPKQETVTFELDSLSPVLPPAVLKKSVLNTLPESFPVWQARRQSFGDGELRVVRDTSKLDAHEMKFQLSSFLKVGEVKSVGSIRGFENVDIVKASVSDKAYIKDTGLIDLGKTYSLVINRGIVKTLEGKRFPNTFIYEYIGEVKTLQRDDLNSGLIVSEIISASDLIPQGALLIDEEIPSYTLNFNSSLVQSVQAKLLSGNETLSHDLFSVGQTVYLSEGRSSGLVEGSVLRIKQGRDARNPDSELVNIVNQIGMIKIVKSEESVSTGIVVLSRDFMLPGDKTIK